MQALDEGQQLLDSQRVSKVSPDARALRLSSRTAFSGLRASAIARLAQETYPDVVDTPAGRFARLPAGQRIVGYPNDNAARVDLGGGRHAVIDSLQPLVGRSATGARVPIDLSLTEAGGAFEPARLPLVLRIPKRLADGVKLLRSGVTITPVDGAGAEAGGTPGAVDGATVLFANTQADADTIFKPVPLGVETDTLLRAADSPQRLYFRLGLPDGASATATHGLVRVSAGSTTIATVLAPAARDAAGTAVPVSMRVSGDTLVLTVDHKSGDYRYPIDVDPTVVDKSIFLAGGSTPGNWAFNTNNSGAFVGVLANGPTLVDTYGSSEYLSGQVGYFEYRTQRESRIYGFVGSVTEEQYLVGPSIRNKLALWQKNGTVEKVEALTPTPGTTFWSGVTVCILSGCAPASVTAEGGVHEENSAVFEQEEITNGHFFGSDLYTTSIEINQETGPSVSVDTADTTVGGQLNGLHTGSWASGSLAKIGLIANDPGIGISESSFSSPQAKEWGTPSPPSRIARACSAMSAGISPRAAPPGTARAANRSATASKGCPTASTKSKPRSRTPLGSPQASPRRCRWTAPRRMD